MTAEVFDRHFSGGEGQFSADYNSTLALIHSLIKLYYWSPLSPSILNRKEWIITHLSLTNVCPIKAARAATAAEINTFFQVAMLDQLLQPSQI